MNNHINNISKAIEPLRNEIINHPVYASITSPEDLRVFMKYHVFAVWDFMSLLKSLQNELTCTSVPWFPKGDAETRSLINEIVAGEESDDDIAGNKKSHFELYLDAMEQLGCDLTQINIFIKALKEGSTLDAAFDLCAAEPAIRNFVGYTFDTIDSKKDYRQAAVFSFGREDLIPGMFVSMVSDLDAKFPDQISIFKYYLERHIEVDGDHHSHLAFRMTANLCGEEDEKWLDATEASVLALQKRVELWNGAFSEIVANKEAISI